MDTISLNATSRIVVRQLDAAGRELSRFSATNDLTNAAPGILMTALLRSGPSSVTHLYCRYGGAFESGDEGYLTPSGNDIKKTVRNDFVKAVDGSTTQGGLWVPLLAVPVQVTSDTTKYSNNQATFLFRIPFDPTSEQQAGATFNPATSYISALGLAVAPNYENDRTQDLMFTALQFETFATHEPFLVPAGGQTAVDYTVQLNNEA